MKLPAECKSDDAACQPANITDLPHKEFQPLTVFQSLNSFEIRNKS